jgi:hypothetical protein
MTGPKSRGAEIREGLLFLKKRSKKTFLNWAVLVSVPQSQTSKSFCAAFFKKRPLSLRAGTILRLDPLMPRD